MAFIGGRLAPWFDDGSTERAGRNMVRVGVHEASAIAAQNTPVDTGDLREHWETSVQIIKTMTFLGVGWRGEWFNGLSYAEYVDQGTGLYGPEHRKYLIVPKSPGGTLHWVNSATGADVFAKAVLHPGSPGQHMLAISANVLESTWPNMMRGVMRNWARETARQNKDAVGT